MDQRKPSPPPSKKQKYEPSQRNVFKKLLNRKRSKSVMYVKKYAREQENVVNKSSGIKVICFEDIGIYSPTADSSEELIQPSSSKDYNSESSVTLVSQVGTSKNSSVSFKDSSEDFNLYSNSESSDNLASKAGTSKNSFVSFKNSSEDFNLYSHSDLHLENLMDRLEAQASNHKVSISSEDLMDSYNALPTKDHVRTTFGSVLSSIESLRSLINECPLSKAFSTIYKTSLTSRESLLSSVSDQTLISPTSNKTSNEDDNQKELFSISSRDLTDSKDSFSLNEDHGNYTRTDSVESNFTSINSLRSLVNGFSLSKALPTNYNVTSSCESLLSSGPDQTLFFPASNRTSYEDNNQEGLLPISSEDLIYYDDASSPNEDHGNHSRTDTVESDFASLESLRSLENGCPLSIALTTNYNVTPSRESLLSSVPDQTLFFPASNRTCEDNNQKDLLSFSSKDPIDSDNTSSTNEDHGNHEKRSIFELDFASVESLRSLINGCPLSKSLSTNNKVNSSLEYLLSSVSDQTLPSSYKTSDLRISPTSNKTFYEDNDQGLFPLTSEDQIDSKDAFSANEDHEWENDTINSDFASVESFRSLANGCPPSKSLVTNTASSRICLSSNKSVQKLIFPANNKISYEFNQEGLFPITSEDQIDSKDAFSTNEDHKWKNDTINSDFASVESFRSPANGCPPPKSLVTNTASSRKCLSSNMSVQKLIFPANNKISYEFNQEGLLPHQVTFSYQNMHENTPEISFTLNLPSYNSNPREKYIFDTELESVARNKTISSISYEDGIEKCSKMEYDSQNKNQPNSHKFKNMNVPRSLPNISHFSEEENAVFWGKLKSLKIIPNATNSQDLLSNTFQNTKSFLSQRNDLVSNDAYTTSPEDTKSKKVIQNDFKPTSHFSHALPTTKPISFQDNRFLFLKGRCTPSLEKPRPLDRMPSKTELSSFPNLALRTKNKDNSIEIKGENTKKSTVSFGSTVSKSSWISRLSGKGEGDQQYISKSQPHLDQDGLDRFGIFVTNQLRKLPFNSIVTCENVIVELLINERMKVITEQASR